MGRGKGSKSFKAKVSNKDMEGIQNEAIEFAVRDLRMQRLQECVLVKKETYSHAIKYSPFSVAEFLSACRFKLLDMTPNLLAGTNTLFGHLPIFMQEEPCMLRLYMRQSSADKDTFSLLQNAVEQLFLQKPLEQLQGWIIQYGGIFILGPTDLDLDGSVRRVDEALQLVIEAERSGQEQRL